MGAENTLIQGQGKATEFVESPPRGFVTVIPDNPKFAKTQPAHSCE